MNFKIIEKSLLPLFLATIFIVAFNWQFTHIYTFLIEHFKEEKLSVLYAHLFIYTLLIFTLALFFINLFKSKTFRVTTTVALFTFYAFSYEAIINNIKYFIHYQLTATELIFMILFVVSTFIYGIYSLTILFFNKFVPFSHSFVFLGLSLAYAVFFINFYCYPISTIFTRF